MFKVGDRVRVVQSFMPINTGRIGVVAFKSAIDFRVDFKDGIDTDHAYFKTEWLELMPDDEPLPLPG